MLSLESEVAQIREVAGKDARITIMTHLSSQPEFSPLRSFWTWTIMVDRDGRKCCNVSGQTFDEAFKAARLALSIGVDKIYLGM